MTDHDHSTAGVPRRVLYVDAGDDGVVDRLAERLDDGIQPRYVAPEEALTAAETQQWDCLVLTATVEPPVRRALLDRVACPSVLFSDVDPATVPETTLKRVDTLVQRGETDRSVGFLMAKVETLIEGAPDGLADGLTVEQFEDVTDRIERETQRYRLGSLVEHARDGLYALDSNGVVDRCNESFAEMLGYEREELLGRHAAELLAPGELETGQRTVQSVLADPEHDSVQVDMTFLTRGGDERELSIHYTVLPAGDDTYGGLMGVARDVTERRERERQIETQRDELAALSRTNVLLREIIGALAGATDRSELRQTVCDRLVESGRYSLAWIGERRGGNDVLVPLASAGERTDYLEAVEVRTDERPTGTGPGGRAYRGGEVQVVRDVREAEQFDPWRDRALSAGLESLVAAPLCHGEQTHGILAVYATEPHAFTPRVERGFAVLGEMIGLSLTAVRNKRLLQREETLRLEFRSGSEEACLTWLARACDCTLETAGAVETGDGVIQYLRVEGADPSSVVAAIRDGPVDYEVAVTRSEGDSLVEIHGSSSLATELTEVGARLVDSRIGTDGSRFVVETTGDAAVRAIQTVVERWNPDVRLVSKTNHDHLEREGDRSPLSALTDRQREILRAAYLSGYYDWPRETTAEDLADSLGIASPTLHQHLRRAESNFLSVLLDR
jgi:PAS domain S-box-containing protein